MIGWCIVIAQQTPAERAASVDKKAAILAKWDSSPGGIGWIESLVREGKATQLAHGGYPNRYAALAGDVLPRIADGPPDHSGPPVIGESYVMSGNWAGTAQIDRAKIAACPSEQVLTIEVWDLG